MPAPSYTVLAPVDCGLPITLTSRVLFMPSDDLIAEGYDSDYQVGPFVKRELRYVVALSKIDRKSDNISDSL